MELSLSAKVQTVIPANTSRIKFQRFSSYRVRISMRARIKDELKAGGSLPDNFSAELTPKGIKINLTT